MTVAPNLMSGFVEAPGFPPLDHLLWVIQNDGDCDNDVEWFLDRVIGEDMTYRDEALRMFDLIHWWLMHQYDCLGAFYRYRKISRVEYLTHGDVILTTEVER